MGMTEHKSALDRLNDEDELLKAMLQMPDRVNRSMVETRRDNLFSSLWKHTTLDEEFVVSRVKHMEEINIDYLKDTYPEYEQNIPDWLLRMEAQDNVLEFIHERFVEEDLIG